MNRKDFFKTLFGGAAAITLAGKLPAQSVQDAVAVFDIQGVVKPGFHIFFDPASTLPWSGLHLYAVRVNLRRALIERNVQPHMSAKFTARIHYRDLSVELLDLSRTA